MICPSPRRFIWVCVNPSLTLMKDYVQNVVMYRKHWYFTEIQGKCHRDSVQATWVLVWCRFLFIVPANFSISGNYAYLMLVVPKHWYLSYQDVKTSYEWGPCDQDVELHGKICSLCRKQLSCQTLPFSLWAAFWHSLLYMRMLNVAVKA